MGIYFDSQKLSHFHSDLGYVKFQAEPYADEEVLNILTGKYRDPEPIYSRVKGYPYSDKSPEFQIPLQYQGATFSG